MTREQILESLGYPLDRIPPEGSLVDGYSRTGNIIYISGQVPFDGETLAPHGKGKVPTEVSFEDAQKMAALCAANALRVFRKHLGSLDNIQRLLRITGYVNTTPDFTDHHLVINGASHLVRQVLGDAGRHARTALGMAQLPLGSSVEVEMIIELKAS